jgi:hypothetical protein
MAIIWLGASQVKLVAWIALVRMSCSFDIHNDIGPRSI